MNTITLSRSKYQQILENQQKLVNDLSQLKKVVFSIAEDEVNSKYLSKLSRIDKQIEAGKVKEFKNKAEIKKFFKNL